MLSHEGAMVFMRREYSMLGMFALVLVLLLYFFLGTNTAIAFVVGAMASAIAGWLGMFAATKANVRTTTAAHTKGAAEALSVAFFGGSVMGLCVSLTRSARSRVALLWVWAATQRLRTRSMVFGMGASSVALFSRVGGGIYTKSADIGADLVGKLEAGIPEDDPRNPGVYRRQCG